MRLILRLQGIASRRAPALLLLALSLLLAPRCLRADAATPRPAESQPLQPQKPWLEAEGDYVNACKAVMFMGDIALDEDDVRILRRNGVLDGDTPPVSTTKTTTAEELQAHLGQFADLDGPSVLSTPRPPSRRSRDRSRSRTRGRRRRRQRAGRRPAGVGGGGDEDRRRQRRRRQRQRRRQRRRQRERRRHWRLRQQAVRVRRAVGAYPERSVSRFKRAATADKKRLWPHGVIPYRIPANFSSKQQALFKLAMRQWENVSCIRFVEKESSHSSYIEFTALDCGCCSYVGRKGGIQSVSIGKNCDKLGIVMHELGHVIGFWHEHTRPDRDKYIEIIEDNILESQKYNFKVLTSMDVDSLGEPYDFDSIMHYARSTFATSPNLDAMRPVQCCPRPKIGQRSYISAGDIRQVHKLYGCRKCGGSLLQESGEFGSPTPTPERSNSEVRCEWHISATQGEKVQIDLKWLDIQAQDNRNCVAHYLEIRDGYYRGSPLLGRFCGSLTPRSVTSNSSRVWIEYRLPPASRSRGFFAQYTSICGGYRISDEGQISSPNYPSAYRGDKECVWKIEVPNGYSVALKFFSFELETHTQCVYDFVEVLEGWSQEGVSLGKFCGETVPKPVKSTTNRMTVRFKSDNSVNKIGFAATFEKEYDECMALHGGQQHGCQHICVNTLGGYHCDCRPGFHLHRNGRTCEDTCGGTLVAMRGTFTSPSYPEKYPPNKHCKWHIVAPIGHKILLNFTAFDVEGRDRCEYDYLDIFDGVDERSTKRIGRYCGDQPPESITSENNTMKISFISDGTVSKGGFSASFMVDRDECAMMNGGCDQLCKNTIGSYVCACHSGYVLYGNHQCKEGGCKHRITRLSGEFSSPNYPRRYPLEKRCSWNFQTTPGHRIKLVFKHFEIERHPDCAYDHVEIRDGPDATSERIGVFCGDAMPPSPVLSSGNTMYVGFVSDSSLQRKGFNAEHSSICGGQLIARTGQQSFYSHASFGDKDYGTRENCNWTITAASPDEVIVLNIETFELESEIECGYDYVDIFDDDSDRGVLLGRYCGNLRERKGPDGPIYSSRQSLHIRFRSDDTISFKGFHAAYRTVGREEPRPRAHRGGIIPRTDRNGLLIRKPKEKRPLTTSAPSLPPGREKGYIDYS